MVVLKNMGHSTNSSPIKENSLGSTKSSVAAILKPHQTKRKQPPQYRVLMKLNRSLLGVPPVAASSTGNLLSKNGALPVPFHWKVPWCHPLVLTFWVLIWSKSIRNILSRRSRIRHSPVPFARDHPHARKPDHEHIYISLVASKVIPTFTLWYLRS